MDCKLDFLAPNGYMKMISVILQHNVKKDQHGQSLKKAKRLRMQQAYTSDGVEAFADTLMVNSEPMMATIDRPSGGVFPVNIGLTLQGSPDVLTKKNK